MVTPPVKAIRMGVGVYKYVLTGKDVLRTLQTSRWIIRRFCHQDDLRILKNLILKELMKERERERERERAVAKELDRSIQRYNL